MKDIKWGKNEPIPRCDICSEDDLIPTEGPIDSPTRVNSMFGGRWANMCERHFKAHGIDTSITTRKVRVK